MSLVMTCASFCLGQIKFGSSWPLASAKANVPRAMNEWNQIKAERTFTWQINLVCLSQEALVRQRKQIKSTPKCSCQSGSKAHSPNKA